MKRNKKQNNKGTRKIIKLKITIQLLTILRIRVLIIERTIMRTRKVVIEIIMIIVITMT